MARDRFDVVVAGGGLIGLSAAFHLAGRGLAVAVAEAGRFGGGASGVAAGMLGAQVEAQSPGPLFEAALAARARYPAFAAALEEEAGMQVGYRQAGILRVALAEAEWEVLQGRARWQRERGLRVESLSASQARREEPALGPEVAGALHFPDDHQVDAGLLAAALVTAVARRGVRLLEGVHVTGLEVARGRVQGVRTGAGDLAAGRVVLAAGPWSGMLAGACGLEIPVRPVRGQLLHLAGRPCPVRHTVFGPHGYLVPKAGYLVAGTTEEEAGFAAAPTLGGLEQIARLAARLVPEVKDMAVRACVAGLRPTPADGLPILGTVPGVEGLVVASGHHRNGVLLAPLTGESVAALCLGDEPPLDLGAFAPGRFVGERPG